eukprot:scaffold20061_cov29-Tisochrysis_lutea.AAC.1
MCGSRAFCWGTAIAEATRHGWVQWPTTWRRAEGVAAVARLAARDVHRSHTDPNHVAIRAVANFDIHGLD